MDFTCLTCGRQFRDKSSLLGRRKFCSRRCTGTYAVARTAATKTSILESELYSVLTDLGIPFEPQKIIGQWAVDAFVPSLNLIIEAQGDFFHCNPVVYPNGPQYQTQRARVAQDKQRFAAFHKAGHIVLELWERSVNEVGAKAILETFLATLSVQTNQITTHYSSIQPTDTIPKHRWFGVSLSRSRFRACLVFRGKKLSLGGYATAEEAAMAYDAKARELFGEFARVNFPLRTEP